MAVLCPDYCLPSSAPHRHENPRPVQWWYYPLAVYYTTSLGGAPLHYPALLKVGATERSHLHFPHHDIKDSGTVFLVGILGALGLDKGGLVGKLGGHLVVEETSREEGVFWPRAMELMIMVSIADHYKF